MIMNEKVTLLLFRYVGRQVLGGQHLVTLVRGDFTCWCCTDAAISDQSVLSYIISSRGLIITAVLVMINNGKKSHTFLDSHVLILWLVLYTINAA